MSISNQHKLQHEKFYQGCNQTLQAGPCMVEKSPSMEAFKAWLDEVLSNLLWLDITGAGGQSTAPAEVPSNPCYSTILIPTLLSVTTLAPPELHLLFDATPFFIYSHLDRSQTDQQPTLTAMFVNITNWPSNLSLRHTAAAGRLLDPLPGDWVLLCTGVYWCLEQGLSLLPSTWRSDATTHNWNHRALLQFI